MAEWDWIGTVDVNDAMPLHAQLERSIRVPLASHRPKRGDHPPPVRQLAVSLRINANTGAKVYTHLERTGALETRRGVGTFVAEAGAPVTARHKEAPAAELRDIAMRALADASAHGFTAADLRRALQGFWKGASS